MKYGNFFTNVAGKSPTKCTLKWNYHGKLWDNDGKNTVYKWWVVAAGKYGWTCEFAYEPSDDEIEVNRIINDDMCLRFKHLSATSRFEQQTYINTNNFIRIGNSPAMSRTTKPYENIQHFQKSDGNL